MARVRWLLFAASLALVASLAACGNRCLNPQPEPPTDPCPNPQPEPPCEQCYGRKTAVGTSTGGGGGATGAGGASGAAGTSGAGGGADAPADAGTDAPSPPYDSGDDAIPLPNEVAAPEATK
jgi:hypothetical protein